jgi:hypothetical protein
MRPLAKSLTDQTHMPQCVEREDTTLQPSRESILSLQDTGGSIV